jgi:hypothetical protein
MIDTQILLAIVIIVIYIPTLYLTYQQTRKNSARRRFFKATNAILQRNPDDQQCIPELLITYKKSIQYHHNIIKSYKSAADFLEELVYHFDSRGADSIKSNYAFEMTEETRKRVSSILSLLKQMQPYASVSNKYASVLETINKALVSGNTDLGRLSLSQLADDISSLEDSLQFQNQVNVISVTTSIVGLILTIIFAMLPFFSRY